MNLHEAAQVAAAAIGDHPIDEQENARDEFVTLLDDALDAADDERLKRINDSIDRLKRDHGEMTTWRSNGGYIALEVPTAFVSSIRHAANDARRDIELRTLTGLMMPQLERIPPSLMQRALGDAYMGNRGDQQRLVAVACWELTSGCV